MKIFNYKIGIVEILVCIMLVWLAWGSYRQLKGLKEDSKTVDGYVDGFSFSGNSLMVWIRFKVDGRDHTSQDSAGPIIRACYYTKGQPCIGQKCRVTYWKKNPNIIDYELIDE